MVLSAFSHRSLRHLCLNMLGLWLTIFPFSTNSENYIGFYLSAGVFSSFTSNVFKLMTKSRSPSLGAVGL